MLKGLTRKKADNEIVITNTVYSWINQRKYNKSLARNESNIMLIIS
jgi:hypothetical protein